MIPRPAGRRRILVPGQVEDDLSVRLGGAGVAGNLDLLARVRAANPAAFIAYKPHPDVVAGHRRGAIRSAAARRHADWIVRDGAMAALFGEIDELHTLTSLSGFEALLRRVPVTVYGRPFYAGWGLTTVAPMGSRPPPVARRAGGRSADPLRALSRPGHPAALRPGDGDRPAGAARAVAAGSGGPRPPLAGQAGSIALRPCALYFVR